MAFAHLNSDRIRSIKKAFVEADEAYDNRTRTLMMASIAPEYVQRLRTDPSPLTQLALDLAKLNSLPKLPNGQIPLEVWLTNAMGETFGGLAQATVFEQALKEMRLGPAQQSDIEFIVEGIEALVLLIRDNPAAYAAVIYYRKTFERALWEIDVIASYKVMHDGLHKLQLNWLDTSAVTVLFANGGTQTLMNYPASLNQTNDDLYSTYEDGYLDGAEKTWIDDLRKLQTQLDVALSTDQEEPIKDAFHSIKDLLTKQLSLLNTRLKGAINKLHLEDLIKAMDDVCSQLTTLSPGTTSQQIQQYKLGVQELTKLDERLRLLITQHDAWQGTDTFLRNLGETLKNLSGQGQQRTTDQERERLWTLKLINNMIETKVGPLLSGTTFWSKRLLDAAKRFSAEVEKSNTDRAEQAFDVYREQAWHFFFEIDTEMKDRCEELKVIGENLRKVNDQLKFNEELDI